MTPEQLNLLNGALGKLVELEKRIALLELPRVPSYSDLSESRCIHCGRIFGIHGGYALYACGAMPKCPYCNKHQYMAWNQPASGAIPSGTLEARNTNPIPWLYSYKCRKCGEAYQNGGYIACGAMPMCPNCGSYQGGAWDQHAPDCSGKHPKLDSGVVNWQGG